MTGASRWHTPRGRFRVVEREDRQIEKKKYLADPWQDDRYS